MNTLQPELRLFSIWHGDDSTFGVRHKVVRQTARYLYVDAEHTEHVAIWCPYPDFRTPTCYVDDIQWSPSTVSCSRKVNRVSREDLECLGEVYHRPTRTMYLSQKMFAGWWFGCVLDKRSYSDEPTCLLVLGLSGLAINEEMIKSAYRRLSIQYHPDHGGDGNAFRVIEAAYRQAMELHRS